MKILDVRELVCAQRHTLIFDTFDSLAVGEAFEFINDHKPTPLYHQFNQRYPNQFSWEYVEEGPQVWRMEIRRTATGTATQFEPDASLHVHNCATKSQPRTIDVRTIPPRERHPLIFQTFDALNEGESFELVNDHDPKPLYYQFLHERPEQFNWEYLEQGPQIWRVAIGRQSANGKTQS